MKTAGGPTKVTGEPTKTASGLEYWDIKVGTGAEAQAGHKVKVDYTGWLTNGKKFDSSVGTGLRSSSRSAQDRSSKGGTKAWLA